MSERYILDRWEGDTAVIEVTSEDDHTHWRQAVRGALPANAREGDVLFLTAQGWQVDVQATEIRRRKMAQRLARLKQRGTNPPQK